MYIPLYLPARGVRNQEVLKEQLKRTRIEPR